MNKDVLQATEKELREAGIEYTVSHGKRHNKVRFMVCGQWCLVVCSRSASDRRAVMNARLEVRRKIRQAINNN